MISWSYSLRGPAALVALSAVWLLVLCTPAFAHARLVQAFPGDGQALPEPPERVELRFNEPVEAEFGPIEVYDEQNDRVDQDDARADPDDARVVLADLEDLSGGSYTVEWRVTSIDGHVIDGEYAFAVNSSEPEVAEREEGPAAAGEPDSEARSTGVFGHVIHYGGLGVGLAALLALALFSWRRR